ncbi:MAG: hypothetical protein D6714_00025 [Bacteroidetes bacterium]|nr:MAG: hypothetical protein D6714_00025 [Bacteroidota bacterium]
MKRKIRRQPAPKHLKIIRSPEWRPIFCFDFWNNFWLFALRKANNLKNAIQFKHMVLVARKN